MKKLMTILAALAISVSLCSCSSRHGYNAKDDPEYDRVYQYYKTGKWN